MQWAAAPKEIDAVSSLVMTLRATHFRYRLDTMENLYERAVT
jgi:hypothetical protein